MKEARRTRRCQGLAETNTHSTFRFESLETMVSSISPETIAGVLVKVAAATSANSGVNFQKLSFLIESRKPPPERLPIVRQWRWWTGLVGVVIGAILDFVAVGLAPQSVVAPAGAFTLVSNVFFAYFLLGESVGRKEIGATALVVSGAMISVAFGSRTSRSYTLQQLVALWQTPVMIGYAIAASSFGILMVLVINRAEALLKESVEDQFKEYEGSENGAMSERQPLTSNAPETSPTLSETSATPQPSSTLVERKSSAPGAGAGGSGSGGEGGGGGGGGNASSSSSSSSSALPTLPPVLPTAGHSSWKTLRDAGDQGRSLSDSERMLPTGEETMATGTSRAVLSDSELIEVEVDEGGDEEGGDLPLAESTKSGAMATAMVTEALLDPPPAYEYFSRLHPLSYATLAGLIGAQSVLFSKCVAEIFSETFQGNNQFVYPLTYVFLVSLVAAIFLQQRYMALGLQLFPSVLIVPVFSSSFMVFSIVGGGIYFQEFAGMNDLQSGMFPVGVLLTLVGVAVLSSRQAKPKADGFGATGGEVGKDGGRHGDGGEEGGLSDVETGIVGGIVKSEDVQRTTSSEKKEGGGELEMSTVHETKPTTSPPSGGGSTAASSDRRFTAIGIGSAGGGLGGSGKKSPPGEWDPRGPPSSFGSTADGGGKKFKKEMTLVQSSTPPKHQSLSEPKAVPPSPHPMPPPSSPHGSRRATTMLKSTGSFGLRAQSLPVRSLAESSRGSRIRMTGKDDESKNVAWHIRDPHRHKAGWDHEIRRVVWGSPKTDSLQQPSHLLRVHWRRRMSTMPQKHAVRRGRAQTDLGTRAEGIERSTTGLTGFGHAPKHYHHQATIPETTRTTTAPGAPTPGVTPEPVKRRSTVFEMTVSALEFLTVAQQATSSAAQHVDHIAEREERQLYEAEAAAFALRRATTTATATALPSTGPVGPLRRLSTTGDQPRKVSPQLRRRRRTQAIRRRDSHLPELDLFSKGGTRAKALVDGTEPSADSAGTGAGTGVGSDGLGGVSAPPMGARGLETLPEMVDADDVEYSGTESEDESDEEKE